MGWFGSGTPKKAPKQPTPKPQKPQKAAPRKTTQTPKRNKPGS